MDEVATMRGVLRVAGGVVDRIDPDQLVGPTPCGGWTVRDVLNHVTRSTEVSAECIAHGSASAARLREITTTDRLGDDHRAAFRTAAEAAVTACSAPGAADRIVSMPYGAMPTRMALTIAIFDVTTHTWDLAKATGQPTALDPDVATAAYHAARLMLTDDMRATGLFGPAVPVPESLPVADRLAAFAGRRP